MIWMIQTNKQISSKVNDLNIQPIPSIRWWKVFPSDSFCLHQWMIHTNKQLSRQVNYPSKQYKPPVSNNLVMMESIPIWFFLSPTLNDSPPVNDPNKQTIPLVLQMISRSSFESWIWLFKEGLRIVHDKHQRNDRTIC